MPFKFTKTKLEGVVIIEPQYFGDERGFFAETFKKSDFEKAGIATEFAQDNHSCSAKGVLRGLHYQVGSSAQGKLVRVIKGRVWDVAVDIRKSSPTFGEWVGIELSAENRKIFFVPAGFAHGFLCLEDDTHFLYKCTTEYDPAADRSIQWNDPQINVNWPLGDIIPQISNKDTEAKPLSQSEVYP